MKRWTSLSTHPEHKRWTVLSQFLNQLGSPNEYVQWDGSLDLSSSLDEISEFEHVRLSTRIGPSVVKNIRVQSSWSTLLGVIDGLVKTDGNWWPLCALYEAYGQVLIELGQDLDMHGNVFVAGSGGAARIAIAAFFKAGFRNFLVTNFDEKEAEIMVREIRSKFFGLSIQWVPMEKIVLLPGESSVLVNCTPSIEENALLVELSYLNFLKRPGFLFDVSRGGRRSLLVKEAHDSGVQLIEGLEIAARTDVLWAKWAFSVELPFKEYLQSLQAAVNS